MTWDSKYGIWHEDEWLCEICEMERTAREMLYQFADGRPYDNQQESRVTRYFGKRKNEFVRGDELTKDDPDIVERNWMRYAEYQMK